MRGDDPNRIAMGRSAGPRLALIAESFARLAGEPLVEGPDLEQAMWEASNVILAHGTEPDPLLFYANRIGLELFEMHADQLIDLPSHRTVEPALREARAAMFEKLERDNIVSGYSGVRVSASGRRFEILGAHVWNLTDRDGHRHGQAATFADWRFL